MKALKFSTLSALLGLSLFASFVCAENGIASNDHTALVKHYENLAKEAEAKLQENKAALEEYEGHSYYYGRQGMDLHSHTLGNIRYYEESLKENLSNAEQHRKMVSGQENPINKAKNNMDRDSTAVR